jgi:hypothetical protein
MGQDKNDLGGTGTIETERAHSKTHKPTEARRSINLQGQTSAVGGTKPECKKIF